MTERIEVSSIRAHDELGELRKEWAILHCDAAPGSPFEHPGWAETWAKYYVPQSDLECVAVRDHALDGFSAPKEVILLGRSALNLSTGPGISKNRWSSTVTSYNDFAIVRGDRRSRWLYGAFAHAGLVLEHYREARLHRTRAETVRSQPFTEATKRIVRSTKPMGPAAVERSAASYSRSQSV